MQLVHFQVGVRVFNCQQILAKISFVIFDNVIKKTNRMWFSVALMKFHWSGINWHVFNQSECRNCCLYIIIQKIAPQAKSGKYFQIWFFPRFGGKMAAFWACACKLSWTLSSPARVQALYGAERIESSGTGLSSIKYGKSTQCAVTNNFAGDKLDPSLRYKLEGKITRSLKAKKML